MATVAVVSGSAGTSTVITNVEQIVSTSGDVLPLPKDKNVLVVTA